MLMLKGGVGTVSIERVADILRLLGDRSRLTIMAALKERELCVCEIVELLGISQPAVSQHLRRLRAHDLVKAERRGQWVYYHLNSEDEPIVLEILQHVPSERDRVERLDIVC